MCEDPNSDRRLKSFAFLEKLITGGIAFLVLFLIIAATLIIWQDLGR